MRRVAEFLFARLDEDRNGGLAHTRRDLLLAMILGITFLAATAYSAELRGWSEKIAFIVGAIAIITTIAAQNRRVVMGCAFGLVAFRMGIGVFSGSHMGIFVTGAVFAGIASLLLLRRPK